MKKTLIKTLLMFASTACFAGAKVQLRPQYYLDQKGVGIDGGIALWQALPFKLQLNSWAGLGVKPTASGYKAWGSANAELGYNVTPKWMVAVGGYFRYNPSINEQDNSVGIKASYKLW